MIESTSLKSVKYLLILLKQVAVELFPPVKATGLVSIVIFSLVSFSFFYGIYLELIL